MNSSIEKITAMLTSLGLIVVDVATYTEKYYGGKLTIIVSHFPDKAFVVIVRFSDRSYGPQLWTICHGQSLGYTTSNDFAAIERRANQSQQYGKSFQVNHFEFGFEVLGVGCKSQPVSIETVVERSETFIRAVIELGPEVWTVFSDDVRLRCIPDLTLEHEAAGGLWVADAVFLNRVYEKFPGGYLSRSVK